MTSRRNSFRQTRRVEFAETDMAGIVHFTNFFRYMEETEHAFLRSLGLSVVMHDEQGELGWPRVAVACDYRLPIRYEDVIEIELRVAALGERSVTYHFVIQRQGRTVADGRMTAVCCRLGDGPPRSIPHLARFRDQVEVYPTPAMPT